MRASPNNERPAEVRGQANAGGLPPRSREETSRGQAERPDENDPMEEMVQRIVTGFDPLSVVLFGSRARGEAKRDSDIDLLVVMPANSVPDTHRVAAEILRVLKDVPVPKDVVVTTPEEIERRGDLVGDVLRPALREGKVLYERA
jgi:predicted nucleotidyltransferase